MLNDSQVPRRGSPFVLRDDTSSRAARADSSSDNAGRAVLPPSRGARQASGHGRGSGRAPCWSNPSLVNVNRTLHTSPESAGAPAQARGSGSTMAPSRSRGSPQARSGDPQRAVARELPSSAQYEDDIHAGRSGLVASIRQCWNRERHVRSPESRFRVRGGGASVARQPGARATGPFPTRWSQTAIRSMPGRTPRHAP